MPTLKQLKAELDKVSIDISARLFGKLEGFNLDEELNEESLREFMPKKDEWHNKEEYREELPNFIRKLSEFIKHSEAQIAQANSPVEIELGDGNATHPLPESELTKPAVPLSASTSAEPQVPLSATTGDSLLLASTDQSLEATIGDTPDSGARVKNDDEHYIPATVLRTENKRRRVIEDELPGMSISFALTKISTREYMDIRKAQMDAFSKMAKDLNTERERIAKHINKENKSLADIESEINDKLKQTEIFKQYMKKFFYNKHQKVNVESKLAYMSSLWHSTPIRELRRFAKNESGSVTVESQENFLIECMKLYVDVNINMPDGNKPNYSIRVGDKQLADVKYNEKENRVYVKSSEKPPSDRAICLMIEQIARNSERSLSREVNISCPQHPQKALRTFALAMYHRLEPVLSDETRQVISHNTELSKYLEQLDNINQQPNSPAKDRLCRQIINEHMKKIHGSNQPESDENSQPIRLGASTP